MITVATALGSSAAATTCSTRDTTYLEHLLGTQWSVGERRILSQKVRWAGTASRWRRKVAAWETALIFDVQTGPRSAKTETGIATQVARDWRATQCSCSSLSSSGCAIFRLAALYEYMFDKSKRVVVIHSFDSLKSDESLTRSASLLA